MARITSGQLLISTGVLHNAVGVAAGVGALAMPGVPARNFFGDIWRDGVIAAIEPDPARGLLFWFLFFGVVVMLWGALLHRLERDGVRLPTSVGWQLLALGLIGGALIPASGFWLTVPQGLWVLWKARRNALGRGLPTVDRDSIQPRAL